MVIKDAPGEETVGHSRYVLNVSKVVQNLFANYYALYRYGSLSKRQFECAVAKSNVVRCDIGSIQDEVSPVWTEVSGASKSIIHHFRFAGAPLACRAITSLISSAMYTSGSVVTCMLVSVWLAYFFSWYACFSD